jgi:hypothetical protein
MQTGAASTTASKLLLQQHNQGDMPTGHATAQPESGKEAGHAECPEPPELHSRIIG